MEIPSNKNWKVAIGWNWHALLDFIKACIISRCHSSIRISGLNHIQEENHIQEYYYQKIIKVLDTAIRNEVNMYLHAINKILPTGRKT